MKKFRTAAMAMSLLLAASFAGCNRKTVSNIGVENNVPATTVPIGENEINAALGTAIKANDTVFTLNSVISPENTEEDGKRYIYFDISIANPGTAYSLSTLNNFYILMNDGTKIYEDVRTQLSAMTIFREGTFHSDPFDIPEHGEFKGIVGGFLVDKNAECFTVGFFPTKDTPTAKGDVILINVNASDIKAPDATMLK